MITPPAIGSTLARVRHGRVLEGNVVDVSVVIPTRNRPESLLKCLAALNAQTARDFEVIVIDDASDAPASTVVESASLPNLNLQCLRNERRMGPAYSRNRGVHAAQGRYIAFVDDDVRVVPSWLHEHLEARRDAEDSLISIGPLAAPADWDAQAWTRWEAATLQREYDRMVAGVYAPTWRQFHTGNALAPRECILAVRGFDEGFLRAEDIELGLRLAQSGCQFRFVPTAIGWHYSRRSLAAWLQVARSYGDCDRRLDAMYPDMHWLAQVQRELGRRHPFLRFVRTACPPLARSALALALAAVTPALEVLGGARLARGVLSVAYELEYLAGLEAYRPQPPSGARPAPLEPGVK